MSAEGSSSSSSPADVAESSPEGDVRHLSARENGNINDLTRTMSNDGRPNSFSPRSGQVAGSHRDSATNRRRSLDHPNLHVEDETEPSLPSSGVPPFDANSKRGRNSSRRTPRGRGGGSRNYSRGPRSPMRRRQSPRSTSHGGRRYSGSRNPRFSPRGGSSFDFPAPSSPRHRDGGYVKSGGARFQPAHRQNAPRGGGRGGRGGRGGHGSRHNYNRRYRGRDGRGGGGGGRQRFDYDDGRRSRGWNGGTGGGGGGGGYGRSPQSSRGYYSDRFNDQRKSGAYRGSPYQRPRSSSASPQASPVPPQYLQYPMQPQPGIPTQFIAPPQQQPYIMQGVSGGVQGWYAPPVTYVQQIPGMYTQNGTFLAMPMQGQPVMYVPPAPLPGAMQERPQYEVPTQPTDLFAAMRREFKQMVVVTDNKDQQQPNEGGGKSAAPSQSGSPLPESAAGVECEETSGAPRESQNTETLGKLTILELAKAQDPAAVSTSEEVSSTTVSQQVPSTGEGSVSSSGGVEQRQGPQNQNVVEKKAPHSDVPVFSIDVECVATGTRHDDRAVAHLAVVDENGNVLMDQYVKPEEKIVSYLTALSGVTKEKCDSGISLEEAVARVRKIIPSNALLVGQGIQHDIEWLGLKEKEDFAAFAELGDLYSFLHPVYHSMSKYSLQHKVKALMNVTPKEPHDPVDDASHSVQLYRLFQLVSVDQRLWTNVQTLLLNTEPTDSFAKKNPIYEGVCMGYKTCKCGAERKY